MLKSLEGKLNSNQLYRFNKQTNLVSHTTCSGGIGLINTLTNFTFVWVIYTFMSVFMILISTKSEI